MSDKQSLLRDAPSVVDAPVHDLANPDDVAFVLRSKEFAPVQFESGHGAQWHTLVAKDSVADLYGDAHRQRRRLLTALFQRATLDEYEDEFVLPSLDAVFSRLASAPGDPSAQTLDLLVVVRRILLRLMARLVGFEGLESDEAADEFERDFRLVERGGRAKFAVDPEALGRESITAQERLVERFWAPAWNARLALVESGDDSQFPNDLMTVMIRHREHFDHFTDDVMTNEAMVFMIAAVGSVTNAICHAVNHLEGWVAEHPEDRANLSNVEFLKRSLSESLRLTQNNVLLRTALADLTVPSGVHIPKGHVARLDRLTANNALAASGTSELEPGTFDPHRSLPEPTPAYAFAFADGAHVCIGRSMVVDRSKVDRNARVRAGIGVTLLRSLYEHGVTLVPDDPPRLYADMIKFTWEHFPVRFTQLDGAESVTGTGAATQSA